MGVSRRLLLFMNTQLKKLISFVEDRDGDISVNELHRHIQPPKGNTFSMRSLYCFSEFEEEIKP